MLLIWIFFAVPSEDPSIPFEPGRTIEVSRAKWNYYSNPATRKPSSPGRLAHLATACTHCSRASRDRQQRHTGKERSIFGLPLLPPESIWVAVWSLIITLIEISYTAFLVPISIAFDQIVPGDSWTWLTVVDCVGSKLENQKYCKYCICCLNFFLWVSHCGGVLKIKYSIS